MRKKIKISSVAIVLILLFTFAFAGCGSWGPTRYPDEVINPPAIEAVAPPKGPLVLPKAPFVLPEYVEDLSGLKPPYMLPETADVFKAWVSLRLSDYELASVDHSYEAPYVRLFDAFLRISNCTEENIYIVLDDDFSANELVIINEIVGTHNELFDVVNPRYKIAVTKIETPLPDESVCIKVSMADSFEDDSETRRILGQTEFPSYTIIDDCRYYSDVKIIIKRSMDEMRFRSVFTHELYHAFGLGHSDFYEDKSTIMAPHYNAPSSVMLSLKDITTLFVAYGDIINPKAQQTFNTFYTGYAPKYLRDVVRLATTEIKKFGAHGQRSDVKTSFSLGKFGLISQEMDMITGEYIGDVFKHDILYRIAGGKTTFEAYYLGDETAKSPAAEEYYDEEGFLYSAIGTPDFSDYSKYKIDYSRTYDVYFYDNTVIVDIGVNGTVLPYNDYLCIQLYGETYYGTDLKVTDYFYPVSEQKQ